MESCAVVPPLLSYPRKFVLTNRRRRLYFQSFFLAVCLNNKGIYARRVLNSCYGGQEEEEEEDEGELKQKLRMGSRVSRFFDMEEEEEDDRVGVGDREALK